MCKFIKILEIFLISYMKTKLKLNFYVKIYYVSLLTKLLTTITKMLYTDTFL